MIDLAGGRAAVLSCFRPLTPIRCPLDDARALVLATSVHAVESVPRFVSSAMDGYALRAGDATVTPVTLAVVAETMAGDPPAGRIGPGEAVRIMTGAPVPEGADAICMVEDTEVSADGASVTLSRVAVPDAHLRHPGSDVRAGQLLFGAGTVLTPRHIGVLASVGVEDVEVRPRLRVGVLSTGNELRPPGVELAPGQIRESNRHMLLALVEEAGAEAVDLGLVADDDEAVVAALEDAAQRCNVVVTSGGVSVGDKDVVRTVLGRVCPVHAEVLRIAIKPAKPLVCGVFASGAGLVGLPGNPVSSLVSFECFVRPALRVLSGMQEPVRPLLRAVAGADFARNRDGRLHLVGASITVDAGGHLVATGVAGPGSHMLSSVADADVLVHVPDGSGIRAGEIVDVQPIGAYWRFGEEALVRTAT